MRPNEVGAKRAFSALLDTMGVDQHWSDGADPPDFWLVTDGSRLAVEVTQVMQQLSRGSFTGSEALVNRDLRLFARRIEESAHRDGLLQGAYFLHMEPVENLRGIEVTIEARLRDYLSRTSDVAAAEREILYSRAWGGRWTIQKTDSRWDGIQASIAYHSIALEQGHVRRMLRERLQERVATKFASLKPEWGPAILLLVDAFHYADDDEWKELLSDDLCAAWHAIVRVMGPHESRVLVSRELRWLADGAGAG